MPGQQYATQGVNRYEGGRVRATGRHRQSSPASGTRDGVVRRKLERFLVANGAGPGPRPSVGASVPISLDRDDCERARIALRQLSVEPTVPDEIEFAAVALEVELERPLQSARRRNRSLTLTLDAADCALIALALLHASDYDDEGADPDAYRCQASRLLGRIDGATPESFDGPSG